MPKHARLIEVQVALEVPYIGRIAGVWKPDEREQDAAWARIQPLMPPRAPVGRPCHDHRRIVSGILSVLRTAVPWREMPRQYGKWDTAYARYRLWCVQGRWQRIIDALGVDANPPIPPPKR
jgi:hypothetical protein